MFSVFTEVLVIFYLLKLFSSWIWQFLSFQIYKGECYGFSVVTCMLFERFDHGNAARIVCKFLKQLMAAISDTNRIETLFNIAL